MIRGKVLGKTFLIPLLCKVMQTYDLLIVGGGATGSALALYAAHSGYKTLLIDKKDFGNATSSASTKLIHGGVRYLELAVKQLSGEQLHLLWEAMSERKRMINNCPPLAHPLKILLPTKNFLEKSYYWSGLKIYDFISWLAGGYLTSSESEEVSVPFYKYKQVVAFYDGQFWDSRYVIANLKKAETFGAEVRNYTELVDIELGKNVTEALLRNSLTGQEETIRTKYVINATGPYADILRKKIKPEAKNRILRSQGIHVVLSPKDFPMQRGLLVPETQDGRILFMLPWFYGVILGTTDTPTEEFTPEVREEDITYLLETVAPYVQVNREQIRSYFSGVRPLVLDEEAESSAEVVRKHVVEHWQELRTINVLGGKWTTHRRMAIDTLEELQKTFPAPKGFHRKINIPVCEPLKQNLPSEIPQDIRKHLETYGTFAPKIAQGNLQRIHPGFPFTYSETEFLIKNHYVNTLDDLLRRRLGITVFDVSEALKIAPVTAEIFGKIQGWKLEEKQKHLEELHTKYSQEFKLLLSPTKKQSEYVNQFK